MKRLGGRGESIVFPELPIVDSHHHLFEREPDRYLFEDYLTDTAAGHRVVASVYVESMGMVRQIGKACSIGDVEFANGAAAMSSGGEYGSARIASAIVGYADLAAGVSVGGVLDRALDVAPSRFRGVRQVAIEPADVSQRKHFTHLPPGGMLKRDSFRSGFAELASRDLSFEAAVLHHQLPDVRALADSFPTTRIVLNHMAPVFGFDLHSSQRWEAFRGWRANLFEIATCANVVCKVGGLGMPIWGFGFESRPDVVGSRELADIWKPYIETAIEAFGVERCMMESNFPADGATCGYVPLWNALKLSVGQASKDEISALFYKTAARVYHIDLGFPDQWAL